jgi:hypothetical protein
MDYDPKTDWTTTKSPMRNNPLYIFGGSEDILEFNLSWFATELNKTDVISRCKWLETMCKADAYKGRPHYTKFKWGNLFDQGTWIIASARYTTANFDKQQGFVPTSAIQKVTIKRVVFSNPTHDQIANYQW